MHVLLQYQSKSYYIIGQEVYYSIGRFITLSGVFYYIIGQLLQYRAFITLSVGTGFIGHGAGEELTVNRQPEFSSSLKYFDTFTTCG